MSVYWIRVRNRHAWTDMGVHTINVNTDVNTDVARRHTSLT